VNRTIGIDLGTTNSAGVVLMDGKMGMVPAPEGPTPHGKMVPSIVAFKPNGTIIVGKKAQEYSYLHPGRTVRWIKRQMGTDHTMVFDGKTYTPQEISSFILGKIKKDAEGYLGEEVNRAVITAPAYFNNNQRNATKEAGELAGFEVLRITSEPTAAALAYGLNLQGGDLKVAVIDLGSGTFDISILRITEGTFAVTSTSGDTQLGGKEMDDALLQHLVNEIHREHSVDANYSLSNLAILRDAAEEAKINLSYTDVAVINPGLTFEYETLFPKLNLTRSRLEGIVGGVVSRLDEPMTRALMDSNLSTNDIDRLVLVGGPTMMPIVRSHIKDFFGIEPEAGIDPMGVVATGAFIQASILNGEVKDLLLLDVTPLSLGIETSGGLFTRLITRNTTIPTTERQIFATAREGQQHMMIHVLQGERETARGNVSLGLFKMDEIPAAPCYEQDVEVTFSIDADGILHVSAEVLETGKQVAFTIEGTTELSENDLAKIIIDATRYESQDTRRREIARVVQNAEAVIYGARTAIQRVKGKLTEPERKEFVSTLDRLEFSLKTEKIDAIKNLTERLSELIEGLSRKVKIIERTTLLISPYLRDERRDEEKKMLITSLKRVEDAPYKEIDEEMYKLRAALLEIEGGG